MIQLSVLKDLSEIVHYDNTNIPLYVKKAAISSFPNMSALCHWHDDIEYIKAIKGHMMYSVNDKKILIKENDGLIVTPKQMHFGYAEDKTNCEFLCILFKPELLCNNEELYKTYVAPIVEHSYITEYYLSAAQADDTQIIDIFDRVLAVYQKKDLGFELDIIGKLHTVWLKWFQSIESELKQGEASLNIDIIVQKRMIQFIYQNYEKKISLNDIAQSGNVCRSRCCQIFKKYLDRTPIDFLNVYRMEISMNLLRNISYSITEIAYSCGFGNPSYYSEIFKKYKGCTPSEYRHFQESLIYEKSNT